MSQDTKSADTLTTYVGIPWLSTAVRRRFYNTSDGTEKQKDNGNVNNQTTFFAVVWCFFMVVFTGNTIIVSLNLFPLFSKLYATNDYFSCFWIHKIKNCFTKQYQTSPKIFVFIYDLFMVGDKTTFTLILLQQLLAFLWQKLQIIVVRHDEHNILC